MKRAYLSRLVLIIIVSIAALPVWAGEEPLKSIAVLEFEAKGVSKLEASTLTDRFRSELVQTKVFLQIERNKIEQIFKEQKLQMSGTVSEDKLVEIGELLGAELLVIGSIGKLASTYTIDLRLVEVESGEIIASYFKDYRGEVDGLLGLFRIIAGEIAGKELLAPVPPLAVLTPVISEAMNTSIITNMMAAQIKAREDADADFSKFNWGVGGTATGTAGGFLLGPMGGLLATGVVAGAGYMKEAAPPLDRISALGSTDSQLQQVYIQAYKEQMKKKRTKWGAGSSSLGCCIGSVIAVMILTSTTTY
ncbi:MAG: CsgG/HfaB family protein [Candidatus Marinimicrobia bacterium]|nr:CsgG/HfaB family protein [Candidatus Neomarinimicrobiota bacterium]